MVCGVVVVRFARGLLGRLRRENGRVCVDEEAWMRWVVDGVAGVKFPLD